MSNPFKIGDKLKVIDSKCIFPVGTIVEVIEDNMNTNYGEVENAIEIDYLRYYYSEFELVDSVKKNTVAEELGVYRPNLEDRKVGKVGMHMFIDGFPNAMYEVAKVMQWAAEVKGYKLHDWKNLPDAEIALSSAGYRHMVDNAVQRASGLTPLDRVDHESNLLHLAHQAFNILAQIELIVTKKIS